MEADYYFGGGWGNHIKFSDRESYHPGPDYTTEHRVWGHQPRAPKVGDTVALECQKSWVVYEFIEVERQRDPPDMFFGTVKVVKQELKE